MGLANVSNPSWIHHNRRLLVISILCLLIVATRVGRLSGLELDRDEIWSVWQTFGTPAQIINWTPDNWPPTYYLLVGAWRVLTGIDPFTLRLMSLFMFLPGIAILYRLGCKLFDDTVALMATTACAAMGYVIHVSVMVRAYSLIFTLVMLAWWLALKYFGKPSIRSGITLGVCILALFYIHFTTIFPVAMIFLFTVVFYPRRIIRWWLPLAIAGIGAIPELVAKLSLASGRASTGMPILQAWLTSGAHIYLQNLMSIMQNLAGYNFNLWLVFVFIAGALIVAQGSVTRNALGLLVWMLAPLIFFFAVLVDAFDERTLVWTLAGYALWIGWGLSRMPRSAVVAFMVVFVVLMSGPVPITENYKSVDTPLVEGFSFLKQHLEAGDVLLIDPNVSVAPDEWDYFTRAYFPNGLQWVQTPQGYRRVWYFSVAGKQNNDIYTMLQKNRVTGAAFTFNEYALQLYEQPPALQGVRFDNGMLFNGVEVLDQPGPIPVYRAGETVRLRVWWSIDQPVKLDYTEGTYVIDSTGLLAQFDGPPQIVGAPHETSRWITGHYYIEERDVTLPSKISTGSYSVQLSVYQWWDNKRVNAPGADAQMLLPIVKFQVKSWN